MRDVVYELRKPAPFGYEVNEMLELDPWGIARSVAKFDLASEVSAVHRGNKPAKLSGLNFATIDQHELSYRYDRALLHILYEMTTNDPWYGVGHILGAHARFVQDEQPSGVDWRSPVAVSQALEIGEDELWQDLHIDVAQRLGWVGLNGKMPIEHVAALYYRGFSGDTIYRLLHEKRFEGISIEDAVKRISGRVHRRQYTYAHPDIFAPLGYTIQNGSVYELAYLEVNEPELTEYWMKDCPKWVEGRAVNEAAIRELGCAGISGIDMFFAELRRDFGRIDAVTL